MRTLTFGPAISTCARATVSGAQTVILLPFRLAALTSEDGWPSFSKFTVAAIVFSYFVGRPVPLGIAIVAISGAFGLKAWLAFLDSKTVTASEQTILARRQSGDHEATP